MQICKREKSIGILKSAGKYLSKLAALGGWCYTVFRAGRVVYLIATLAIGFTPVGGVVVPLLWFGGGTIAAKIVNIGIDAVFKEENNL